MFAKKPIKKWYTKGDWLAKVLSADVFGGLKYDLTEPMK